MDPNKLPKRTKNIPNIIPLNPRLLVLSICIALRVPTPRTLYKFDFPEKQ